MKRIDGKVSKKRNGNGKLLFLVLLIGVIVACILFSSMCNIKSIKITIDGQVPNNNSEAEGENSSSNKLTIDSIKSLSSLNIGENMFKVSKGEITKRLKTNPYVDEVKINKKLDGNLEIHITQRKTRYLINYAGAYIYIDERWLYFRNIYKPYRRDRKSAV